MSKKARLIAFYLPQFHPIPENDSAWGVGFTEWTNVTKALPLFPGHIQPKLPADLGFYDLRVHESRVAQAEMARKYGIEGFCYWHYWLGNGRRLLERPFQEVLESGEPDFPFCLGWANHSWDGKGWMGGDSDNLIEQKYPGKEDAYQHFCFLLKAFQDKRYIKVNGKPLLVVYRPRDIPDPKGYFAYWRQLAKENGLSGLHIIGDTPSTNGENIGLDGYLYSGQRHIWDKNLWDEQDAWQKLHSKKLKKVPYSRVLPHLIKPDGYSEIDYPVIIPNWDTTPRLGDDSIIFYGTTPSLFKVHVRQVLQSVNHRSAEENIIFIRAWNEWAEGNYLEPDLEYGHGFLEALKSELDKE